MSLRETVALNPFVARHLRPPLQRLNRLLPHRIPAVRTPRACVYLVYRARNAATVRRLVESFPAHTTFAMHALDDVAGPLAGWTVSTGPGMRTALLSALLQACPPGPSDVVVLSDDDVALPAGAATTFLDTMAAGGLDLAQPAHGPASHSSHGQLTVRPFVTARRTNFVEIGPLLALAPSAHHLVDDVPADIAMGWGLDAYWCARAAREGLTMGVVDSAPMVHLGAVAVDYSAAAEVEIAARYLGLIGDEVRTVGPRWMCWQKQAPWPARPAG